MVAYKKPQQRKKEESERLRGERDKTKFDDLRFERGHVVCLYIQSNFSCIKVYFCTFDFDF